MRQAMIPVKKAYRLPIMAIPARRIDNGIKTTRPLEPAMGMAAPMPRANSNGAKTALTIVSLNARSDAWRYRPARAMSLTPDTCPSPGGKFGSLTCRRTARRSSHKRAVQTATMSTIAIAFPATSKARLVTLCTGQNAIAAHTASSGTHQRSGRRARDGSRRFSRPSPMPLILADPIAKEATPMRPAPKAASLVSAGQPE